ncbi:MAG: site-specific integrase [Legionellales bacterium]|nr:site-specific integrase [Legionellales bacterium]
MARTANFPKPFIDTLEYLDEKNNLTNQLPSFTKNDLICVLDFLKQYQNNKATFESYRREVERLMQWSWLIAKKSLLDLKRQDIETYLQFCLNPPKSWIGLKKVARFVTRNGERTPNPAWRPFVANVSKSEFKKGVKPNKQDYQLSQKAIREIFTVLSSFYNYLALEEKLALNPIALIKQKSKYLQKRQQQSPVMRLSETQWQACLETVKAMAATDPDKHERTLFIISALYLLYLRISELVASDRWEPQMGHFYQDSHNNWWFKTLGKGNKLREIAVSDDMLIALMRYRESMKLPALPALNDQTPLLPKEKGKGSMTSSRHIRRLVQYCFDATIEKLRASHKTTEADALGSATVHWLRHTGISDDINKRGRPVAHVRDDAGHSSSAITDRYNDIELTARHKSAKGKKLAIPIKN